MSKQQKLDRLLCRGLEINRIVNMAILMYLPHGIPVLFGPSRFSYRKDLVNKAVALYKKVEE